MNFMRFAALAGIAVWQTGCAQVAIYELDRRYSDSDTAPGGYLQVKVDRMLKVLSPSHEFTYSANGRFLAISVDPLLARELDRLVPAMLCETANTGRYCQRVE